MRTTDSTDGICATTRKHLDFLLHNKKSGEVEQATRNHLANCPDCAAEWESRKRLQADLQAAVEGQSVPVALEARIRQQIRAHESTRSWLSGGWPRLLLGTSMGLAICTGIWLKNPHERLPALSDRPAQDAYIQRVSAALESIVKVGLGDHIHCSIFRKYPKDPPTIEQMEQDLGPSYKGLLSLVKGAVPAEYKVIMAHQCGYAGRKYIHFTFRNGDNLLSLVITRKQDGESLGRIAPAVLTAGVPIYQSQAQRYQIASFDGGRYFAYVVSSMDGAGNLQIASNLAPAVRGFLTNV